MLRTLTLPVAILLGALAARAADRATSRPFDAAAVAQARAATIKKSLPDGWSILADAAIITLKRNEQIQATESSPLAPSVNEVSRWATIKIDVRVPITAADYARMANENEVARRTARALHPNYDPVDRPLKLPHSLPTHYDDDAGFHIGASFNQPHLKIKSDDVARECQAALAAATAPFRPYLGVIHLWGTADSGLAAALMLERPLAPADGKPHLAFLLRNTSDKPIRILRLAAHARYWGEYLPLEVRSQGEALPYRGPVLDPPPPPAPADYIELAPDQIDSVVLPMNPAHWKLADPAKAALSFVYKIPADKDQPKLWTGAALSPRIPLK